MEVASCIARSILAALSCGRNIQIDFCLLLSVREYLDNVPLFQGCSEKMLDSISVLLREVQVFCSGIF